MTVTLRELYGDEVADEVMNLEVIQPHPEDNALAVDISMAGGLGSRATARCCIIGALNMVAARRRNAPRLGQLEPMPGKPHAVNEASYALGHTIIASEEAELIRETIDWYDGNARFGVPTEVTAEMVKEKLR